MKKMRWIPVMLLCVTLLGACGASEPEEKKGTETAAIQNTAQADTPEEETTTPDAEAVKQSESVKQSEQPAEEQQGQPPQAPTALSELNGSIEEVMDQSFKVTEIITEDLEDGSQLAIAKVQPEETELIEVAWTENTTFTVRSSSDMGTTSSDTAGSAADLQPERTMIAKGRWEGDVFIAAEIVIYQFH